MSCLSRALLLAGGIVAGGYSLPAAPMLSAIAVSPLTLVEGATFNGSLGTFTDDPNEPASNFTATIDWGDASMSAATIVSGGAGNFTISGNHAYGDSGSFSVTVALSDSDGDSSTGVGPANVADAPLTPLTGLPSFSFAVGSPVGVTFGSFSDGNPFSAASEFTATIDWGDASTSTATIVSGSNGFSVFGEHTYVVPGNFFATVDVADDGGSSVEFRSEAIGPAAVPEPGSIGMALLGLGSLGAMAWRRRSGRS